MAVVKSEHAHFTYIRYTGDGKPDLQKFSDLMSETKKHYNRAKDIIVDVSQCDALGSMEIGSMARVLTRVADAGRFFRIVASDKNRDTLEASAFGRHKHVVIYDKLQDFVDEMTARQGDVPVAGEEENGDAVVVKVEDPVSGDKAKKMVAMAEKALAKNCKQVVLDLSQVQMVDSYGVAELMYLDGKAKGMGKTIALSSACEDVMSLFKDASLDQVFRIIPAS